MTVQDTCDPNNKDTKELNFSTSPEVQVLVGRAIRAKGLMDEACDVLERRRSVVLYDSETDALRVQDRETLGKMIVHNFMQNY